MSKREEIQDDLVAFMETRNFNAPYGILVGFRELKGGGKARQITFGVSRYLDAEITIWSDKNFTASGQGALAYRLQPKYHSLEVLKNDLAEIASLK